MSKKPLQFFTFGLEIEGLLSKKLFKKLEKESLKQGVDLLEKTDGSVSIDRYNIDEICQNSHYRYLDDDNEDISVNELNRSAYTEFTMGIIQNYKGLNKFLSILENKGYYQNNTCGIHLHLGCPSRDIKAILLSKMFIKSLEKFCLSDLCDCNISRLESQNRFCRLYSDRIDRIYNDIKSGNKYRLVRNHKELGTIELRLFSACNHRKDNIAKVVNFIDGFLKENKPEIRLTRSLSGDKVIDDIIFNLKKEKLDFKFKVDNPVIDLCVL